MMTDGQAEAYYDDSKTGTDWPFACVRFELTTTDSTQKLNRIKTNSNT